MTNFRDDLPQSGAIASGLPTSAIASDRLELLVIDPSVQDYGQLIDGLRPGVVVYVLHPQQDGIEQITELLQHYNQQIQALHLITHGDRGQLHLGHSLLTTSTLGHYGRSLQRWSTVLAPQADILIYGCQVADGMMGYGFIRQLQALTGANIAAASTPIGHPSLGGTWDLDVTLGAVHTPIVVNPATQQTYPHCLIPTVSISDLTVEEDVGDAVFIVTLSEPATDPVVLDFNTSDFSAIAGGDYTAVSGRLTIPSGGTQAFITVPIIDDDLDESRDGDPFEGESFEVDLSIVSGADATNSSLTGFGSITDNDPAPVVNLLNTGVQVTEGVGAVARFTVGLSGPAAGQITVNYTLNNGTATDGEDYFFPDTPSLVFLAQETQKVIDITILDDDIYEKNGVPETFSLEIFSVTGNPSGDGVELGSDLISTVSITDNELAPVVSINSLTVLEDAGTAVLEATLSNASDALTRVTYDTADDTAVSTGAVIDGTRDYDPRSGTLSFVAGTTSTLLTITVVDDVVEEVNEQFFVNLTGTPVAGSVNLDGDNTQGVVTIRDNEGVPIVTVLGDSQAEGTDLAFIVQLSREGTTPVIINYITANGTAITETLTPEPDGDNDYTFTQGSLTFAPGQTELTVVVPTAADEIFENDETLTLQLSLEPGADDATFTGGSSVGTSTILNDDPAPVISVEDVTVNEGALGNSPGAVFTFLLDRPSQAPVTVTYETADGTAESGGEIEAGTADYAPRSGLLTFTPGSTIQRLTVTVNGDNTFEDGVDETFVLNLSDPSNGSTLNTPQVTGTLLEDDAQPAIAILDTSVTEGNSGETTNAVFTVQLTNPSQSEVTVTYSTGDGTASSSGAVAAGGSDYVPVIDETLTFAPGETQQLITIAVNGDDVNEGNENFTVTLDTPTGATLGNGVGTGTIVNNDGPPAIALLNNAVTVNEGDSGETANAVFTVQLSNPSQTELTVTYSTNDDTARSDGELNAGTADFSPIVNGVLVFAPGETQQLITVTVNGDDTNDLDEETFNVVLNGVTGGEATLDGTASSGTVTILDDDDQPAIAILDTSVIEGNSGDTTAAIFTVQLTNPSQTDVTVDYSTANITTSTGDDGAAGGDDYVPVVGDSLTFAPGETQQLITIAVNGDDVNELDETFSITLINPNNATLDDGLGIGTILDDDNTPVMNISNATVLEGNTGDISTAVFTVSLSNPNQAEVTVAYTTEDGTAIAGGNGTLGLDDYQPFDSVLTFAAGETQQFITITVNGDGVNELDETFNVRLSPPNGGPSLGDNPGTGTIIDNDDPPTIAISNASVLEGNLGDTSNAIFTVSLSNPSQDDVTVTYSTADGTASSGGDIATGAGDFEPVVDGTLTFTAGETQRLITIAVNGDGATEGTETFNVNLTSTSAGGGIADGTGLGTIVDNDGPPAIAILGTSVTEGALNETTNAVFTVSLTNPSSEAVTVTYTTANITTSTGGALAAGGDDYLPVVGGTVTFAPGEIERLITITVNGDDANEGDETFSVTLFSDPDAGGAALVEGGESAIGIIGDDDDQPAIAILGTSVLEGDAATTNAIFTVQLSNPSQTDITVDYSTEDDTARADGDAAVGGNDYDSVSGSLTFVAGETQQLVTVTVNGDGVSEPSETFNVVLSGLGGDASIANNTGVGTIGDDDAQPTITIDSRTALEGASGQATNAIFTVRLTTPSQSEVTVNYNTANGTASFGGNPVLGEDDYVPVVDGVLTFAPGAVQQLITITVNGDDVDEADETFDVILSNASGANLEPGTQATGTIIDDDDPAVISISNASVLEGDLGETSNAVFTVRLSSPTPGEVSVTYSTADDTASSNGDVATGEGDYTPVTDEVIVFAPGETERLITIAVNGDGANEEDETFTVTLNNLIGDATPGNLVGVGTIVDNDGPPAIAILGTSVTEGALNETTTAVFTVSLTNPSQNEVTVNYNTANITTSTGGTLAAGGDDYLPVVGGIVTFAPGEIERLITITVNGDDANEGDETFSVTLSNPTSSDPNGDNATLVEGGESAIGIIGNDDDQAAIAILGTSVLEGDATTTTNAIFTVQLSNPSQTDITVDYSTTDGSALANGDAAVGGNDYDSASGSLTFVAGETLQLITVTVNGDGVSEPSETFNVVLDNLQGNVSFTNDTGIGTIVDDDAQPAITINDVSLLEGDSGETTNAIFTVNLTTASQEEITVDYTTQNDTAIADGDGAIGEDDYDALTGTVTFVPGSTQQLITIAVNGDAINELTETFTLVLSNQTPGIPLDDTQATGTIGNDDNPPAIAISNASVPEGDLGDTDTAVFTVSLSNPSQEAITVTYSTADDTATSEGDVAAGNDDYVPLLNETLVFNPGETAKLITVTVNGDDFNEGDETFNVVLDGVTGDATLPVNPGIGTIVDNDVPPAIAINNVTVQEGDGGDLTNAVFTVQLDRVGQEAITVDYSTANGTANAGGDVNAGTDDYTPLTGTLTFAPGETTALITVTVNGDDVDEIDETFTVTLNNPSGDDAVLSGGVQVGTGTIVDDDDQAAIAILGTSVLEGDATTTTNAIFTVQLSNPSQTDITVDYSTTDGSALADGDAAVGGNDYDSASGSLTFVAGETLQLITVTVNGDGVSEPSETFNVVLDNLQGNATVTNDTGVGTIVDDDAQPAITINDVSVLEGDSGDTTNAIFTVNLTTASQEEITVDYTTQNDTAIADGDGAIGEDDYDALTGTVTFVPGSTQQLITIAVNGDAINEPTETFTLVLSNQTPGIPLDDTQATGTIGNDDNPPAIAISNASVLEGDLGDTGTAVFTVSLSNPSQEAITVIYSTTDDTATSGGNVAAGNGDYIPVVDGVLNFAAGETLKLITITVNGDDISEGTETFNVNLTDTGGATPSDVLGIGTIGDNDLLPQITILDTAVQERGLGETAIATHTVLLSAPSAQTVTVDFATANGTASVANNDYLATFGQLTFAPGQTVATINVTVVGDDTFEPDETYVVNLSGSSNASLSNTQGIGTIENDDLQPVISIFGVTVDEGDAGTTLAPFTVQLSRPSSTPVIVAYQTSDGTATTDPGVGGNDYTAASGFVTFVAGQTTQVVNITVNGDTTFEGGGLETFDVRLSNPTGGILSSSDRQATGGIRDDDDLPTVVINDATVVEGDTGTRDLIFTVSLSGVNAATAQVGYQVNDGTATAANNDYLADTGTLVFAPGQTEQTLTVQVVGDTSFEEDETLTVALSGFDGMAAGDAVVGTGTILNDDQPTTYNFARAAYRLREGDRRAIVDQVQVVRSGDINQASTVTVLLAAGNPPATPRVDFTPGPITVTFAPRQTTALVPLEILGDTDFEPDEVINLSFATLPPGTNGRIGTTRPTATFTILNDDPEPQIYEFNRASYSAREPRRDRRIVEMVQVTRSGDITVDSRVDVRLTGTSATAGNDFLSGPVRVQFSAGETAQMVPITILADDLVEDDEEVRLSFTNFNRNGIAGDQNTATFTILDNPPPVEPPPGRVPIYDFTSQSYRVREGDRRRIVEIVQVTRSGNTAINSQVDVRLRGTSATAGDDFVAGPVQVQFSAGETIQAVPITILADDLVEDDEEVRLSFTNFDRNGVAGDRGTANLVILDNSSVEPPPGRVPIYDFTSQSYRVREGDRRRIVEIVQVTRSGNTAINSQVDVRLRGTSATAGDDFVVGPVQVQFSAGETIQAVPITILADDLVEDDEEVRLSFTNFDRNGVAGDRGTANLVILDNSSVEPPPGGVPIYNFTAQRYRIREGDRRQRITEVAIRRTGNLDIGSAVSVNIRGVTRNPATPGQDLSSGPIRVRFRPGEEIKRVPIAIFGDRTFEPHEVARLNLSNFNQGGRGGPQRWTRLVIVNDDPRPPVGPRCPLGDRLVGDDQDNVLRGGRGRDTLIGRSGDDRLVGGACNDRLVGDSGDDILDGGGGNDVLIGGPGNDTLIGGTGKNTFIFEDVLHGVDVIQDFKPGHDRIDLRRLGIRYRDLTIGPSIGLGLNRSTVISVNGNNLAVLRGIDRSEISARRDFLL